MREEPEMREPVANLESSSAESRQRGAICDEELQSLAPSYELQLTAFVYGQAFNLYQKVFKVVGQKVELTIPQFLILYALLLSEHPLSPTGLSKILPIEPQSITAVLDRLERRKLVVRRRSSKDRRAIHVRLTPDGHDLLRDRIPAMKYLLERTIGTLSPEERHSLQTVSRKLSTAAVTLLGANPENIDEMIEFFTKKLARLEQPTAGS